LLAFLLLLVGGDCSPFCCCWLAGAQGDEHMSRAAAVPEILLTSFEMARFQVNYNFLVQLWLFWITSWSLQVLLSRQTFFFFFC
jgi:hypothetical protein